MVSVCSRFVSPTCTALPRLLLEVVARHRSRSDVGTSSPFGSSYKSPLHHCPSLCPLSCGDRPGGKHHFIITEIDEVIYIHSS